MSESINHKYKYKYRPQILLLLYNYYIRYRMGRLKPQNQRRQILLRPHRSKPKIPKMVAVMTTKGVRYRMTRRTKPMNPIKSRRRKVVRVQPRKQQQQQQQTKMRLKIKTSVIRKRQRTTTEERRARMSLKKLIRIM